MTIRKKHTFEERLPLILAFLIPILIMIGVFAGKSIYPFGDKSFLRTDMYHQYAPFFMDFLNRLKAGESLTYAWEIGLGSNYVALMAYYLSSPFNLLLTIFPEDFIVEFMTYLIVLKIGLCGLTMAIYLSVKNKTRHMGIAFFAICYALSGYLAAYSWNIMWLDCLWLAPLIVLGLERLVQENKPFLYGVSLGLAILTNYYISIMLCIFMVVYFICLIIMLPKQTFGEYLKKCGLFALFSLIAGGLAAVLLIPAAYALMTTASADTTFPTKLTSYFSLFEMLSRHLINVEVEIGLDHWPNLYSGVATLLFLPMYYLNRRIPYKEKIVKTVLLFFLLLSFSLNIPNYIWHGFHYPNSLPCRQSFLYTLIILSMCFEGFKGFKGLSRGKLVACFWGVAAFILVAEVVVDPSEIAYHSFYVSLIFVGLYALMLFLYKTRRMQMVTAMVVALGILVLEMGLNTAVTSVTITSRSEYWRNTESFQTLLENVEEDELFYRTEKVSRKTKNDGAWAGYPSASIFSSTAHAGVSDLYKKMGLEGNTNAYSFMGATPMTSSLLSVRYMLSTEQLAESPLYQLVGQDGEVYLYENLYTLPLGFMIPSDTASLWEFSSTNPARVQNSFVNLTTELNDVLTSIPGNTSGDEYSTTVNERSHVYVFVENSKVDDVTASIDGTSKSFSNVKRRYLLDLGYCEAGASIRLTTDNDETLNATAYVFNDEAFLQVYEALNSQRLNITSMTNTLMETSLTGQVTAAEDGLLFTSIPYEKGWTVKVDGVVTEAENFADTFLAIPLTAGTHDVELSYVPEGLLIGAIISASSLGLLLICALIALLIHLYRKKKGAELPETEEDDFQIPVDEDILQLEEEPETPALTIEEALAASQDEDIPDEEPGQIADDDLEPQASPEEDSDWLTDKEASLFPQPEENIFVEKVPAEQSLLSDAFEDSVFLAEEDSDQAEEIWNDSVMIDKVDPTATTDSQPVTNPDLMKTKLALEKILAELEKGGN